MFLLSERNATHRKFKRFENRFYEIMICSFDYFNKISFNSCLSFSVPNKAMSLNAAYSKKGNKLCKQNHQQHYLGIYKQLYSATILIEMVYTSRTRTHSSLSISINTKKYSKLQVTHFLRRLSLWVYIN